ncbi:hypothetical protein GWK47_034873 [Chionoecetes opilio]|uniref:Uncharacterized protein n=1 Tax=Chionoecetes opilio TaxID=41210 RepID=A0A8J4YFT9_CHIOP|nr:hypothetical protein GWK47_034873 [Chionoecetes opilio]
MFPLPSLRGIHEGPSITELFEDSNVRTRGRAEAGFEDILEDHLVDMMAAGQPKQASSEFLLNPNASTLHHASVQSRGVETEGDDLSLTPASFKTTFSPVSASRIRAAGTPRRNRRHFPCEETAMRSSVSQRGTGGVFRPKQDQPFQVSPGSAVPRSSRRLALSPKFRARWTVLFPDRHTPNVHSKNLSGSFANVYVAFRTDNFSRSQVEMRLRSFTEIDGDCLSFFLGFGIHEPGMVVGHRTAAAATALAWDFFPFSQPGNVAVPGAA